MGSAVENARDRLERLLARGIPDLDLDYLSVYSQVVAPELYSDGDLVLGLELVIHHALHQAGLSHARVSNNNELE